MAVKVKNLVISVVSAGLVILAACASAPAAPVIPAKQPATQSTAAQPQTTASQPDAQQNTKVGDNKSTDANSEVPKAPATTVNRVDVIYFHANQRCVTCLCFEQHVNHVIDTYFIEALNNGKLTFQVLNLQQSENEAITKKYQAVGSQLFINVIINGIDTIQDIQNIWNWKCTSDPNGFERKLKNIIEGSLREVS
ncbi:MAG: nitrophenyl compound nitroreductase subunit ArsF family protein [Chloroflexi bacterium]|nr:nitrophenyl compound nitroreductase subunit ArsF family protein [Chloroflexota bacterium]